MLMSSNENDGNVLSQYAGYLDGSVACLLFLQYLKNIITHFKINYQLFLDWRVVIEFVPDTDSDLIGNTDKVRKIKKFFFLFTGITNNPHVWKGGYNADF